MPARPWVSFKAVKGAARFELVLQHYGIALEPKGTELVGRCPFHDDSRPSFNVNPEKGAFHSFGCGANGLLWAAAGAILASLSTKAGFCGIERSLLLRTIFSCDHLVSCADPDRLSGTITRLQNAATLKTLKQELPEIRQQLDELESWLELNFEELLSQQADSGKAHRNSDPLWRPGVGWVIALEDAPIHRSNHVRIRAWRPGQLHSLETQVKAGGFYVNVRLASRELPGAPEVLAATGRS